MAQVAPILQNIAREAAHIQDISRTVLLHGLLHGMDLDVGFSAGGTGGLWRDVLSYPEAC